MRIFSTIVLVLSLLSFTSSAFSQERSVTRACTVAIASLVEAHKMLAPGLRPGSFDEHAVVGAIDNANRNINTHCSIEGQIEAKAAGNH